VDLPPQVVVLLTPETSRAAWAVDVATHRDIDGRRWRTSDPRIPADLRQALVDELMAGRRAVKLADDAASERAARARVHDAKVALGERGSRWWQEDLDAEEVADRVRRAARVLSRVRATDGGDLVAVVCAVTSTPEDEVRRILAATSHP
jgi:hypothetical protein